MLNSRPIEIQHAGHTFIVEWKHRGQYRPYGDSFYVAEIKTSCPYEDVVLEALRTLPNMESLPKKGKHFEQACALFGASAYFNGYYDVEKIAGGWKYTECKPYTD